jgi:pimeloyl-ACP methyl ester carboxylesterase
MKKLYILHGWSNDQTNKNKWSDFINNLCKQNYQPLFLKIPGLDFPLKKPWTIADYISWLLSQLKNEKNLILIGHSFGGQLACLFSSLYPDKINKLILIDSAGIKNNSPYTVIKRNIFKIIAKTGKIFTNSSNLKKLLYKLAREHDYEKADPNLKQTFINVINTDITKDLKNILFPTLIIWGEKDKVTPLFMAHKFNNYIKNSQLHLIKEGRHSPQFTHTKEVTDTISNFLQ